MCMSSTLCFVQDWWPRVQLLITSPLSRAIKTGLLARPPGVTAPVICTELCRERIGTHPCDHRRKIGELAADFPEVNFELLQPREADPHWTEEREPWHGIVTRSLQLLDLIMNRYAVVTRAASVCASHR